MYRQPLVRTDSGYHMPSSEEVITGIRAFFDPAHLSSDGDATAFSAEGEDSDLQRVREVILRSFQGKSSVSSGCAADSFGIQPILLRSILYYMLIQSASTGAIIPPEVSDAISKVSRIEELRRIQSSADSSVKMYLDAWINLHLCLEKANFGPVCECPFVYFFVKYCLDQGFGVPKLALALYDRMNMQLSREFIRCANPTCELNRLDKSTGQVKFKQCSRCKAVIYCSRECQTAHYPDHKRLCREHLADREGS